MDHPGRQLVVETELEPGSEPESRKAGRIGLARLGSRRQGPTYGRFGPCISRMSLFSWKARPSPYSPPPVPARVTVEPFQTRAGKTAVTNPLIGSRIGDRELLRCPAAEPWIRSGNSCAATIQLAALRRGELTSTVRIR